MLHRFRAAYGWTDDVTLGELQKHGGEWLLDTHERIVDDIVEERNWLMLVTPLARTPDSKRGARRMTHYGKRLRRYLELFTPWVKERRAWERRQRLRRPPQSRMTVVERD